MAAPRFILPGILILMLISPTLLSQDKGYRMPPKTMADIIDAPPTPSVEVGPMREWMLLKARPNLPSIEEVSQPELRIAGIRINPRTNGRSRSGYHTGLTLMRIADGKELPVPLPEGIRVGDVAWSPDGKAIAFTRILGDGLELWVFDRDKGEAKRMFDARLNGAYGTPFRWLPDGRSLVCRVVPVGRGDSPQAPGVPEGPVIQTSTGRKAPARTFQDLLKNPHDESLFEYYMTSELVRVDLDGRVDSLNISGLVTRTSPSPHGRYLLVERIHRPYSYLVPLYRFPRRIEVRDFEGVLIHEVADLPLAEDLPLGFNAVPLGPRSVGWRADAPATLYWVEALDGGDPKADAEFRDLVYMLPAPFDGKPFPLFRSKLRYSGITWGRGDLALVNSYWWKNRKTRTWIVKPDVSDAEPILLFERSFEDRYSDPGRPVLRWTMAGTLVLLTTGDGNTIFYSGSGASEEGNRPFLDRRNLITGRTERLWRSQAPYYESVVALVDEEGNRILTRRESKEEPPNFFLRDLAKSKIEPLTRFPHPAPQLKGVQKELIRYAREDGVQLTATLYLPSGYKKEDGPLPVLMWAYPREYKSADAAGQVRGSPHQFIRTYWGAPVLWVTQGFAVLDGPSIPIIGEGEEEPNDTYVEQLVASAEAAIDELERRGVGDPDRVAVGGHSYGAFMCANLLAHSDLFRAGIARSGAYNRTLTPFGFQAEERTFWETPETYFAMSPFMHAHKVNEPLLLIHGAADNNSGTFPLQSERFYHALKGHGAAARLVMLPAESHGYRARESVMHTMWEMNAWLEKYVKGTHEKKDG